MSKFLILPILLYSINIISQDKTLLNNSFIAFTAQEKDLLPESIAYNPMDSSFYMSSTRKGKVLRITKDGQVSDFIKSRQDGLWMTVGLKIDVKRQVLWVCSSGGENLISYTLDDDKDGRPAGIFKYSLKSGKLIKKYVLDDSEDIHFFNDLCITKEGDVYATHMFGEHAIYKISYQKDELEKHLVSDLIPYPNGITLSEDHAVLYVAHSEGIALINLKSKAVRPLELPDGLQIKHRESIDGLYLYNNSLVGVQSDIKTIQRFYLNTSGDRVTKTNLLEINHPMMDHPTTGEIVNDHFYYIANAQFGAFNKDGSLYPMEKLYEPVVLKLKLGQ